MVATILDMTGASIADSSALNWMWSISASFTISDSEGERSGMRALRRLIDISVSAAVSGAPHGREDPSMVEALVAQRRNVDGWGSAGNDSSQRFAHRRSELEAVPAP